MRPVLHLTAETGWINDPHAISYHDGRYHVFFQYVPDTVTWSPHCRWGHVVSDDLLHFETLPVALSPGDGDDGVWTGSIAHDETGSTIFYTSVQTPAFNIGTIRSARPADPEWRQWVKGPVVVEAPPDLDLVAYRDPFVFRDGAVWRMFVGGALAEGAAAILSYSSTDLHSWSYDGIAAQRSAALTEPAWTGSLWECPQIFEIDGRHVLVTSVWHNDLLHSAAYGVGHYADGHFDVASWGRLTYGPCYYAPSFFRDRDGQPSLVFWIRTITDAAAGWIGAHSVPHTLTLDGDRLVATPADHLRLRRGDLATDGRAIGRAVDVEWIPQPRQTLTASDDSSDLLQLSAGETELTLDVAGESWTMPHDGTPIRLIFDGPILEISTGTGLLAVPLDTSRPELQISASGGRLQVWPLSETPVA